MKKRGLSVEKTAETRQKIILAALDSFIELGFANSKVAAIASAAGLGKGTIYSYFDTKDALFEGVIDYLIEETLDPIQSVDLPDNQTVADFIVEKMVASVSNIESSGRAHMARLILSEGNQFPHLTDLYRQKIYTPWNQEIQKLLQIAIDRQELPSSIDTAATALLINAPIWMVMVHNGVLVRDEPMDLMVLFVENVRLIFKC
ncbi:MULTISPECIES: TetR/AcrR family transcriptional regulator [Vitreoscilla]|uniref:TetR/AcrR family transcriptional regulator n=1 Tax=Vitreoscilla stercoraria TaxID=61 RepID=A0ABY4E7B7_VITST|nr:MULTISPECIES: TetR/AcrR family transcriptional regulator [Vitreoscilla]AUZ05012.2 putative TetR family transcriptional regulator [Vitreoscilla sp. C1]UOO91352.1 TetR/AcrR family transcriptional regulator [Vitreoscilla stercoraria]